MGIGDWWDTFTEGVAGAGGDIISAAIPGVITGLGAALAPKPETPYSQSQEYLDAKAAQDQANFMAQLELEKQKLALAGAGSGSALAAARLAAAVQIAGLKERALSTRLAAQMQNNRGIPEIINQAANNTSNAMLARGQAAQQGFTDTARLLAGYRQ